MVKSLYSDFDATADRLPYKEEESFKLIAKEANKAGLSVISMNPGERRPMLDVNNSHVFVENVQCFEIPINIEMQGGYKEIGEYLRSLREDVPVLIKVEDIVINKEGAGGSQLKAKAEFILHVLSQD
ncbi:MAG: type 4a pilus biogenesis protein PilO [Candidatus Omnitrophica bacterium]|nr:type 4a pilus biogenesis protein PilO [Candidatus Omnitrophota bacterium]